MYLYLFESISSRVASGFDINQADILNTAKLHIHIIFVVKIWIVFLGLPVSGSRALAYLFFIREGCSCNMFACPFLTDLGNPVTAPLLIRLCQGHTTEKSLSLIINFRTILTFLTPCPYLCILGRATFPYFTPLCNVAMGWGRIFRRAANQQYCCKKSWVAAAPAVASLSSAM